MNYHNSNLGSILHVHKTKWFSKTTKSQDMISEIDMIKYQIQVEALFYMLQFKT